jgi:type II secretory pathway component PulC
MDLHERTIPFLKNAERILIVLNALLFGFLVLSVGKNYLEIQQSKAKLQELQPSQAAEDVSAVVRELQPFSVYESQLGQRNLFQAPEPKVPVAQPQPEDAGLEQEPVVLTSDTLPEHLKVVGIIVGKPSEVVIEDTKAQQTFFIQEGDNIGDFAMQRLGEDKIIIKYQGQNFQIPIRQ